METGDKMSNQAVCNFCDTLQCEARKSSMKYKRRCCLRDRWNSPSPISTVLPYVTCEMCKHTYWEGTLKKATHGFCKMENNPGSKHIIGERICLDYEHDNRIWRQKI
jgi:hypothetical protein